MRTRTLFSSLLIVVLSVLALVATRRPAYAQNADVCYAVADQTDGSSPLDALVTLDRVTGVTTLVGMTGTRTIEAIASPASSPAAPARSMPRMASSLAR